jgi:predicted nucleic acid-binding protein
VIGPEVVLRLAGDAVKVPAEHKLVAPTLLKSQVLSSLFEAVRRGELTKKDADRYLNYLRGLKIRLLSDRVSQSVAWRVADELGWADTYRAEYVAVTQLQADAFVTLDERLADAVKGLVTVAPLDDLRP